MTPPPHDRRATRPRFTIGAVMVAIAGIALVLAALRPLAGLVRPVAPRLAEQIAALATVQTGALLACLALGGVAALALMKQDESG